jgi:hypothetical protein
MESRAELLDAYGSFIASLADWSHFVTLTHRTPEDPSAVSWHRVGVARHRRLVRDWFYECVRPRAPGARWWSEMEFHVSGQPHEHGMLAVPSNAPDLEMRDAWWQLAGYAKWLSIAGQDGISPAAYASKYAQKATSREPMVFGVAPVLASPLWVRR